MTLTPEKPHPWPMDGSAGPGPGPGHVHGHAGTGARGPQAPPCGAKVPRPRTPAPTVRGGVPRPVSEPMCHVPQAETRAVAEGSRWEPAGGDVGTLADALRER